VTRVQLDDLLFGGIIGVILGGRLGYVLFYKPGYYFTHPLEIFAIWQGGMSFHGGFLGVLAAMAFVAHRQRVNWWDLMDFVAPLVPIGLATGRLGNFINGELWGRVTDLPWGMVFRGAGPLPRHPQLPDDAGRHALLRCCGGSLSRPRMQCRRCSMVTAFHRRRFAREPDTFSPCLKLTMGQWSKTGHDPAGISCSSSALGCKRSSSTTHGGPAPRARHASSDAQLVPSATTSTSGKAHRTTGGRLLTHLHRYLVVLRRVAETAACQGRSYRFEQDAGCSTAPMAKAFWWQWPCSGAAGAIGSSRSRPRPLVARNSSNKGVFRHASQHANSSRKKEHEGK
jgi:phosphatidylglycerol:prolipoprotein diacylglycerol transferase